MKHLNVNMAISNCMECLHSYKEDHEDIYRCPFLTEDVYCQFKGEQDVFNVIVDEFCEDSMHPDCPLPDYEELPDSTEGM